MTFFFCRVASDGTFTLSLHDALPISRRRHVRPHLPRENGRGEVHQRHRIRRAGGHDRLDRKSTRLNSSHVSISYAVFCLKKKKDRIYVEWAIGHYRTYKRLRSEDRGP